MSKSYFKLERKLIQAGYDWVIGIDEAGRGPLAGPVVACACTLIRPSGIFSCQREKGVLKKYNLIRDSKMLSEKQREGLYDFILENFYIGVGICDHKTIDRINILQAAFLAMNKAIASLARIMKRELRSKNKKSVMYDSKFIILVDGNRTIPNCSYEQRAIIGGDKLVKSISAASIIAKVTRDRIMRQMHKKHPEYHFDKHKGYGTKLHAECLKRHGPCRIHRRSFRPVKAVDFNS